MGVSVRKSEKVVGMAVPGALSPSRTILESVSGDEPIQTPVSLTVVAPVPVSAAEKATWLAPLMMGIPNVPKAVLGAPLAAAPVRATTSTRSAASSGAVALAAATVQAANKANL